MQQAYPQEWHLIAPEVKDCRQYKGAIDMKVTSEGPPSHS